MGDVNRVTQKELNNKTKQNEALLWFNLQVSNPNAVREQHIY